MEKITSLENKKVKAWTKLNEKKYRDENQLFLVEGDHLVKEALKNNIVQEIICIDNYDLENNFENTYYVTNDILSKISNVPSSPNVVAVCKKIEEKQFRNRIVLIDGIQDPGNLGTIIRSCVAFNFDTIVLGNNTVDLYNDKTIRATEGMIFNINILKKDLLNFIDTLKKDNYYIYGTDVSTGYDLNQIEVEEKDKIAFVVGNEGSGVSKEILNKCDQNINIKINNKCESLNVSVATGIILHKLGSK